MTVDLKGRIQDLVASSRVRWVAGIGLAVFILINIVLGVVYHNKTLPHTTINNKKFSSISYAELDKSMSRANVLPKDTTLTHDGSSATFKTSDLGVEVNTQKVIEESKKQRSFLPIINYFSAQPITAAVKINGQNFNNAFVQMSQTFKKDPVNAQINQTNGSFELKPESNGYRLDAEQIQKTLQNPSNVGKQQIAIPSQTIEPEITKEKLQTSLGDLQKQQNTPITLRFQNKSKKLTKQEVGALYVLSGSTPVLSDQLVKNLVANVGAGFGIKVENTSQTVTAIKDSLAKRKTLDYTLKQLVVKKTLTYCIQLKGVDASNMGALESKLASTYADSKGWSLGGQVAFTRVTLGCNFTVWLAASNQVPSFGPICDTTWSCTARPNVVINYDRWVGASPAWNAAGGNLEDYRTMVINHETGHWLGFGHKTCGGAGQAAPVMLQQSIDLQGCTFNPWPTAAEVTAARRMLGI